MFYILAIIVLTSIPLRRYIGSVQDKRHTDIYFSIFTLAFVILSGASGIYLARFNTFSSQLQRFIGLSKNVWGAWAFSSKNRGVLVRIITITSCIVPLSNLALTFSMVRSRKRQIFIFTLLSFFYVIVFAFFDPDCGVWLYCFLYPKYLSYVTYLQMIRVMERITHWVNCGIIVSGIIILVLYMLRLPKYAEIWRGKILVFTGDICLSVSYLLFFNWAPCRLVKYSKLIGEKTFFPIFISNEVILDPLFYVFQFVMILLMLTGLFIDLTITSHMRQESRQVSMSRDSMNAISRILLHYVKNELLAIKSEVELAKMKQTPQAKNIALDRIQARCNTIWEHIETARTRTEGRHMTLERTNLASLVNNTVEQNRANLSGFQVEADIDKSLFLQVDRISFGQVIGNLIQNAIEASQGLEKERKKVQIDAIPIDRYVRLRVRDFGTGMDDRTKELAFQPYFSNKPTSKNWGLGLTLCKSVIQAHHGLISIDTHQASGTTVTILIPYGEGKEEK